MDTTKLEITLPSALAVEILDLYYTNEEIKAKCVSLGISIQPLIPDPGELKEDKIYINKDKEGIYISKEGLWEDASNSSDKWVSGPMGMLGGVGSNWHKEEIKEKKSATDKQIKYLSALGWRGDIPSTQSEASKLINKIKKADDSINPAINPDLPTQKQLNYLNSLGWKGDKPSSKKDASALIDRLKLGQNKAAADRGVEADESALRIKQLAARVSGIDLIF